MEKYHVKHVPLSRSSYTSQWRHNEHDGVWNHRRLDCLLNRLFKRRSKKTSKLRVTGLCDGYSPVTGEFPAQRATDTENVSIWWRHHATERIDTGGGKLANTYTIRRLWCMAVLCDYEVQQLEDQTYNEFYFKSLKRKCLCCCNGRNFWNTSCLGMSIYQIDYKVKVICFINQTWKHVSVKKTPKWFKIQHDLWEHIKKCRLQNNSDFIQS